jgi:hypothetical protein
MLKPTPSPKPQPIGGVQQNPGQENSFEQEEVLPPDQESQAVPQPPPTVLREETVVRRTQKTIAVQSPNGGETLCLGNAFTIHWSQQGVEQVRVSFLRNSTSQYELGVFEASSAAGVAIPAGFQLAEGSWQAVVQDAANPSVVDISDSAFTLRRCGA